MKSIEKPWILGLAMVCLTGMSAGFAQDTSSAAATDSAPAKNIQMVAARASLNKGIDAKKVKQGDAVTAKLQDDVKIPDAVELPKNTVLLGRVDQVQPSENKGDSQVQVTFDKAQLRNGQQLAIKATIMQIVPPPNAMMNNQEAAAGSPAMSSPAPAPGGSSGGGMQAGQAQPAPSAASAMPDDTAQPASQHSSPGVQLQSDIHQSSSGTFISKKKNVHLDDGTQFQMAVAVIPPNTQIK